MSARTPPKPSSLAGFRAWVLSESFPEKLKATFFDGEVFLDMSKEDIRTHAAVKTAVSGTLFILNQEIDFGDLYINGVLITNIAANVSNNPDAVAVFWNSLKSGRVRYVHRNGRELEIEGSPDWTMEIVSESSVFKDTELLRKAYHRARVREYWLIDARGEEIDCQILHWRKGGYVAAKVEDGWQLSRVFGRQFHLVRRPDRRGAWHYELLVKAAR